MTGTGMPVLPACIAFELIEVGQVHGGDEDDRRLLVARMVRSASSKPSISSILHVHEDDGNIGF